MARNQPQWEASELFCPRCKQPRRVNKRMLLALADGDKYDYICTVCGEVIGAKMDKIPGNFGRNIR
jgi:hypothetical protein